MAFDEDLADRIREQLAGEAGVDEQRMFGGLAFLVAGHMAVAASGRGGLMVRVDPEETETLLTRAHVQPFEMRGRELAGWVRVAPEGVPDQAPARALGRARRRVRALAPAQALRSRTLSRGSSGRSG